MKLRHFIQGFFLLWILIAVFVLKRNLELWCPMGGLECLYSYFVRWTMLCSLGITNFFMLAGVLILTLCLRRVFCGYLCPLGAIAEFMRALAAKVGFKQLTISHSADRILSILKYLTLAVVLGWTWRAGELIIRGADPCYAVLTLGEEALWTTYAALVLFILSAFFISMPFCRWLCPLAAGLNLFSRFGGARIVRDTQTCIDCGACTRACPMAIPVASVKEVTSARCISCMECLDKCPVRPQNALRWKWLGRVSIKHPKQIILIALIVCLAVVYWAGIVLPLPSFIYQRKGFTPQETAVCHLQVDGVKCGGSASLFVFFLERQDLNQIPGYLKVSMSPAAGYVDTRIEYDPTQTSVEAIQEAIMEPFFDEQENRWRPSPFTVKDYEFNMM